MSCVPRLGDNRVTRFQEDLALACTEQEVDQAMQRACRTCRSCECSRCPISAMVGDFKRYVLAMEPEGAESLARA